MKRVRISKRIVDGIVPGAKEEHVWDSEVVGFGIRIRPSGALSYIVSYRSGEGRRGTKKRVTLAPVGKITPDQARALAKGIVGDIAKGADPAEEKRAARAAMTVSELCDSYLEAAEKGLILGKRGLAKKASTLYVDRGRIDRHIKPLIGKRPVRDLTTADISRFMRDVTTGKTAAVETTGKLRGKAIVQGGAGTAARTVGLLGGILSFAVSDGVIQHNPVRGVRRPADRKRTRRLTPEEYQALGKALGFAEAEGAAWQAITCARLLALTGCRLGEIVGLRWDAVDATGSALRLADSKAGASVRPLGRAALKILEGIERNEGNPYVLTGVRGDGGFFGGFPRAWAKIVEKAELEDITAHTLRHSFASMAADLGYSEITIGAMLGHSTATVTSRYTHHLDAVLIAAADRVSRAIDAAMAGTKGMVVDLYAKPSP